MPILICSNPLPDIISLFFWQQELEKNAKSRNAIVNFINQFLKRLQIPIATNGVHYRRWGI
jgi:hypothetical protein